MLTLTIGLTKTNRPWSPDFNPLRMEYVPSVDGWMPGSPQDEVVITFTTEELGALAEAVIVAGGGPFSALAFAEAAFIATNAPGLTDDQVLAMAVADKLALACPDLTFPRAVSVGDTITINNRVLACKRIGWEEVTHAG